MKLIDDANNIHELCDFNMMYYLRKHYLDNDFRAFIIKNNIHDYINIDYNSKYKNTWFNDKLKIVKSPNNILSNLTINDINILLNKCYNIPIVFTEDNIRFIISTIDRLSLHSRTYFINVGDKLLKYATYRLAIDYYTVENYISIGLFLDNVNLFNTVIYNISKYSMNFETIPIKYSKPLYSYKNVSTILNPIDVINLIQNETDKTNIEHRNPYIFLCHGKYNNIIPFIAKYNIPSIHDLSYFNTNFSDKWFDDDFCIIDNSYTILNEIDMEMLCLIFDMNLSNNDMLFTASYRNINNYDTKIFVMKSNLKIMTNNDVIAVEIDDFDNSEGLDISIYINHVRIKYIDISDRISFIRDLKFKYMSKILK